MAKANSYSVFEYGYLVSEQDKGKLSEAVYLPPAAFRWLEQRCLKDKESDDQRLLALRTMSGVKVIQVKNYVGVIALPQQRFIEVLPKTGRQQECQNLARSRLLIMLKTLKSFRHLETTSASVMTSQMPLMDIFVQQFISSVEDIVKRGLKRDYLRQQENEPWLKGKLLVGGQLKKNNVRRDRFFVEYDDYRVERPENRLLKTAIDKVYSYTSTPALLQSLNRLHAHFEEIPAVGNIDVAFRQVHLDRHMQHYEKALEWAKLILEGKSPHCMQGSADATSLLFPMEAVFEAFVTAWLREHCQQHWQVKAQSRDHHLVHFDASPRFQLKPDVWLIPHNSAEKSPVICDMKWKIIESDRGGYTLAQGDLYQMLAYGMNHLQGEGDMLLIYPRHDGFTQPSACPYEYRHSVDKMLRLWIVPFEVGDSLRLSRLITAEAFPLIEGEI